MHSFGVRGSPCRMIYGSRGVPKTLGEIVLAEFYVGRLYRSQML